MPLIVAAAVAALFVFLFLAGIALLFDLSAATAARFSTVAVLVLPSTGIEIGSEQGTVDLVANRRRSSLSADMAGEEAAAVMEDSGSAAELLSRARKLLPVALEKARRSAGFAGRWKVIVSKLERVPSCLSDLSSHPCFARNSLCREQLQSLSRTISDAIELAERCGSGDVPPTVGRLRMQSDLDALSGQLELNLRDCALLVKTGVLGDTAPPPEAASAAARWNVGELLARLQIGDSDAKHRAVDGLLDAMRDDEKAVLATLGRSNASALVQLLSSSSPRVKEKAASIVCLLVESGTCDGVLVAEGVLPPLIRLMESGGAVGREKAVITLQRLTMSPETARSVVGLCGVRTLIELAETGDSVSQSAAAGALKNLSGLPEARQALADEGVIGAMTGLLDGAAALGAAKEYAAECLQNLTASNESLRRSVVASGGLRSILAYLDRPLPQEPAVAALRNLVGTVAAEELVFSMGILPCLIHVMRDGSPGAQAAAAAVVSKLSTASPEAKRVAGEATGMVSLLVRMMEAKSGGVREAAAMALAAMTTAGGCLVGRREVKKEAERAVASLVQLLEPSPGNGAKKHAMACLMSLSSSGRCRKLMVSYGCIGYLKKLADLDVAGARRLLSRLERGKIRSLFATRKL